MKNIVFTFLVSLFILMLTACGSTKLADIYDENAVIDRAKEVVDVINTHDYVAMQAELRDDLEGNVTPDQLKSAWDKTLTEAGDFQDYKSITTVGQKSKSTGEDYAQVVLVCNYKNSTLIYTIVMDANLEIVGMYLK
jgi:Na+-transporting NADH:ubiquinone oxidoreductase subunit NqrC